MKNCALILLVGIFIFSCSTTKNRNMNVTSTASLSDTVRIANDSLEYEILIIEPGFNAWVISQRPRGYFSEVFLENRNRLYVMEYNQRVIQPLQFDPNLYPFQINYDPNIRYGYEVNYLLYHYFLFFEQQFRQRFMLTRGVRF
ncbi:DUF6146 family protein [Aquimarina sp. 2201CG1-2-11]|uniref:DUF6146 family protein n=1 Tax=Aquimarina discodermiae TaxID=3231043 RepID=UPI003462D263